MLQRQYYHSMKHLYNRLLHAGAAKATSTDQAEKMVVLNKCLHAAFFLFILNTVYEARLHLPVTVTLDCSFLAILLAAMLLNAKGRYFFARNIVLTSANLLLLAGTWAEGIAAGNYLHYFPLTVVFILLLKAREERKLIIFLLLLTSTCILLSFVVCPWRSRVQVIAESAYKVMFTENLGLAFILVSFFTYIASAISFERERQMIKAREAAEESTRVKSMFLSNMSHELRTPLNGIIGTANLLLDEDCLPAQKEHLDVLRYSSGHMLTLINDILDFNKIDANKIDLQYNPVSLAELLNRLESVFARQFAAQGLHFTIQKSPLLQDIKVLADETRLTQVLNNLLANALKFTHKGEVTLSATVAAQKSDLLTVDFTVTDTGIGIPLRKQDKIFDSFTQADTQTTRQYGGTGLGLSISKKIVAALGGELLVKSTPGRGSNFYFTLSFTRSLQPFIPVRKKQLFEPLKGMRLLIAEDNPINMKVARKFLQGWNITIAEAVNGLEAVEKSRNGEFDALLLDLEMPEMDGYTALHEIRRFNKDIPAIAFSAAMFPNIKAQLEEKGFNDFVTKPFRPEDLYQKIKQYCKS
jgi:signal transduction histidine kinase